MNEYPNQQVLEFIYGRHYSNIYRLGLRTANLRALPGMAFARYIRYVKMICGDPTNKAYFHDTDARNCEAMSNMKEMLVSLRGKEHSHVKKISILNQDVFKSTKPCRVEDLGVGEHDADTLMPKLEARLFQQSQRKRFEGLWKAQIIDMSKRGKGGVDVVVFKWLRYYFRILGAEMTAIDGLNYDERIKRGKIFSRGEEILEYSDTSGKTGRVYDHFLKFEPYGRLGFTKLYTYYNGGPMISVLVIYK